MSFKWIVPSFWPAGCISIQPEFWELDVNESKVCKVTFTPGTIIRIWDMDLTCVLTNESAMKEYNANLEILKRAISEGRDVKLPSNSSTSLLELSKLDIRNLKYKPLPAIGSALNAEYLAKHGPEMISKRTYLIYLR